MVLAEVTINLKTTRPPSNYDNSGGADVKDALYCNNRDVNVFGFANLSKIQRHKVGVIVANRTVQAWMLGLCTCLALATDS